MFLFWYSIAGGLEECSKFGMHGMAHSKTETSSEWPMCTEVINEMILCRYIEYNTAQFREISK